MKHRRLFVAMMVLLLLAAGCGGGSDATDADYGAASMTTNERFESGGAKPESMEVAMDSLTAVSDGSVYQRSDAKLIRRCTMEMQTTEFDVATQALYDLVSRLEGYFESSTVRGGSYYNANAQRWGEYVIRIPAERYNEFRAEAGELFHVTYNTESSDDVGEQYYDTEARLKTLRTKQERLLALLEKAETMEDIISLESALSEVEYEIEQHSSTLNRYDGLISYATFTISVQEVVRVDDSAGEADSLGERMRSGFASGLEDLVDGAQDFLVWLSYHFFAVLFLVIVGGGAIFLFRRKARSLRQRRTEKNGIEKNADQ